MDPGERRTQSLTRCLPGPGCALPLSLRRTDDVRLPCDNACVCVPVTEAHSQMAGTLAGVSQVEWDPENTLEPGLYPGGDLSACTLYSVLVTSLAGHLFSVVRFTELSPTASEQMFYSLPMDVDSNRLAT